MIHWLAPTLSTRLTLWTVPFPDELASGLAIVTYDPGWPREFRALAARLQGALGSLAQGIDHIGSTAVPGLAAKDCIDIQVRVDDLDGTAIALAFDTIGFRLRPEPWNRVEATAGKRWPKLVFAPPISERAANVHVRESASATVRRNLLFRDFLRGDDVARNAWGDFKQRLTHSVTNIYDYGQIKSPATEVLMMAAEDWVRRTAWTPSPRLPGHPQDAGPE